MDTSSIIPQSLWDCISPPSLNSITKIYQNGKIDFENAIILIKRWRNDDKYICFKKTDSENKITYCYSKASKRGNDVYRWRVTKRHQKIIEFCNENHICLIQSENNKNYSQIIKITGTVAIKKYDKDKVNSELISYYDDLFKKRIRNKYSRVRIARTYEVSRSGYLHINWVLYFPNNRFEVRLHKAKQGKHKGRYTWRLAKYSVKQKLDGLWELGHCDIRAVENTNDLIEYVLKYQIKYFTQKDNQTKQDLTLSVLSLYNKRSFSIPDSFVKDVIDHCCSLLESEDKHRLDKIMHNSLKQNKSEQGKNYQCEFIGLIPKSEIHFNSNIWFFESKEPPSYLFDLKEVRLFTFDQKFGN